MKTEVPPPPPMKRVTRTIIIEGTAQWVDETIEKCLVPTVGDVYRAAFGKVACIDRKEDLW